MRFLLVLVLSIIFSNGLSAQYFKLPDVQLKTFYGKEINQSFLNNGRDASIIILSTKGCPPCDRQIDSLLTNKTMLEEKYGARIIIVVQNFFKGQQDSFEQLKTYASSKNWETEVYIDEKAGFQEWLKSESIPVVMLSYNEQLYAWTKGAQKFGFTKMLLDNFKGNTRWYDKNWDLTTEKKHVFYREIDPVQQPDSSYRIKDYYKNGQVQMEGAYLNLKTETQHGKFVWYKEDGSVLRIKNYANTKYHGLVKEWTDEGLLKVDSYYHHGKKDSTYKYYYDNGSLWSIVQYKKGKIWNVDFTVGPTGDTLDYGTLLNGNGTYKSYNQDGKLETFTEISDGLWHGERANFNVKTGKVLSINYYDKGYRNSEKEYSIIGKAISNALVQQDVNLLSDYTVNTNNVELVAKSELSEDEAEEMLKDKSALIGLLNSGLKKTIKKAKIDVIQHHGAMINQMSFSYAKQIDNEELLSAQKELEIGLKNGQATIKFKAIVKRINYKYYIVETIEIKPE